MKLPQTTIKALDRTTTDPDTKTKLDHALALAALGFGVFPLAPGTKVPIAGKVNGRGGALLGTTDETQIRTWFESNPRYGVGLSMMDDLAGFDLDFDKGCPAEVLDILPPTRTHYSGRGNGNRHLIYRVDPGVFGQGNGLTTGIDFKTEKGAYLVGPPTPHEETGKPYYVGDENGGEIRYLTEGEMIAIFDSLGVQPPAPKGKPKLRVVGGSKKEKADSGDRKTLIYLLDHPGEGGRNNWLTRVAGHYAKQYHGQKDLYDHHCHKAYEQVAATDFDWYEASKTIESIWDTENAQHPEREAAVSRAGYLQVEGDRLVCPIKVAQDEIVMAEYAPWTIEASGVAVDSDSKRTYWATLRIDGREIELVIPGRTMGNSGELQELLAQYGADVIEPALAWPQKISLGTRLHRFLRSQNPPEVQITERLGLQKTALGEVFVTLDGVITEARVIDKGECLIVADPGLAEDNRAPYHYGFSATRDEAVDILRRVLEFQEETTTSVFGAWWAACWLKPAVRKVTSLFPFMGIEATSGSGKTTGFFGLMVQLNGNKNGQTVSTTAAFRDSTSANYNGIVWVDDDEDLEDIDKILRSSTSEGEFIKKGNDNKSQVRAKIVAPILLSGEALGLSDQKALVDRSIILNPPPATGRKNAQGQDQWSDVVAVMEQYPLDEGGLSVLSGWFVQVALRHQDAVLQAIRDYPTADRLSNKYAILVAGAMLLDTMLAGGDEWVADGEHRTRVEGWVQKDGAGRLDNDNTITLKLIPDALRQTRFPTTPTETVDDGPARGMDVPCWITPNKGDELIPPRVFFRAEVLSDYTARSNRRVVTRTETVDAIRQQAKTLGLKSTMNGPRDKRYRSYELPPEYAQVVLDRAQYVAPNEH